MTTTTETPVETQLVVDGEWRPAAGGGRYELYNPAWPDELVGTAAAASREDAREAIAAAHRAFPGWSALSYEERASYLTKIADRLVDDPEDVEARVRLLTREHGKVLMESTMEVTRLGDRFRYCASLAECLSEDDRHEAPPFDTIVTRQPRGVSALITPWNWPLSILGAKLPQALISGNPVVIKLSERATLAPALTIRRIAESVPQGVVNLVTGMGPEVGDELVSHPLVRKVSFTGGTKIGSAIMARAAETLKHVTLELGGNDPALVLEDADLSEGELKKMVMGTFLTSGQVCMALKRLYVHESRYEELVDGFTAITEQYVVGNGLESDVTMGPLNNKRQLEIVREYVAEAKSRGATVRGVGRIADEESFEKGFFPLPTIVTDADPSLQVVRCEQFGPVLPVIPFKDARAPWTEPSVGLET